MDWMTIASIILVLSVGVAILNQKYLHSQTTIAVMSATLLLSLLVLLGESAGLYTINVKLIDFINQINFSSLLMNGMLGYLLFAGALHIEHQDFKTAAVEILTLATLSTLLSTVLVAWFTYALINFLNITFHLHFHLSWIACLLFGALISPTDPIAVLGILKAMDAPRSISTKMAGESLFNDGIGIVLFLSIYQLAYTPGLELTPSYVTYLFTTQAVGGLIFGVLLGLITQHLIQLTQGRKMHILITLAMVTGGYTLAHLIGASGPLAMVALGMMVNLKSKTYALPNASKIALHQFWEIIDELLNIILFFLLGTELLTLNISSQTFLVMLLIIPFVLFVRWITVSIPIYSLGLFKRQNPHTIEVLVWGGLRGGLAVAMALSLPSSSADREMVLLLTYAVVVFSILVQGSTVPKLVRKRFKSTA